MNKKVLVLVIFIINMAIMPLCSMTTYAEWSYIELTDVTNDLWSVWGSSEEDVYAVGTLGINLHYDGNPEANWRTLPDISP